MNTVQAKKWQEQGFNNWFQIRAGFAFFAVQITEMKKLFTILSIIVSCSLMAQTTDPCFYGAGIARPPFWCGYKTTPEDYEAYSKQDINRNLGMLSQRADVTWLPVFYHVITRDDGACGGPLKDIIDGHCELNQTFLPFNIGFYIVGLDTIPDTYLWNYEEPSLGMATFDARNVPAVINVYINGNMPGLCGFATFPNGNPSHGGIFLHRNCIGAAKTTYQHEMGHYLGLMHTFETTFGVEFVNGANCSFSGDLFCDTPADFIGERVPCPYTGDRKDPNGDLYRTVVDPSLYMSYFNDGCQTRFSTMQQAQMVSIAHGTRSYLLRDSLPDMTAPDTTSFINPVAGNMAVNSSAMTFKWHSVPHATHYRFFMGSAASLDVMVDTLVTDTFVYVGNLHAGKQYKYYAKPVSFTNVCASPASYHYIQTSDIKLSVKIVPPVCYDSQVDTIVVTPTTGEAPYRYQWAHGSEDSVITNVRPGDYYVTVTDAAGREVTQVVQMIPPGAIKIDIQASGSTLVALPSGGTPPYTFLWSNGVTNQYNNNPSYGEYSVLVTDAIGCFAEQGFSYTGIGVQPEVKVSLRAFPNPASGNIDVMNVQVVLNEHAEGTVSVLNVHGELMQQFKRDFSSGATNLPVSIEPLASGLYFIRFASDKTSKTEKFTVIH